MVALTDEIDAGIEWWAESAQDADIWNGPGDGVDECLSEMGLLSPRLQERGSWGLDLGCGSGRLLIPMARQHPRAVFIGYDVRFRPCPPLPHNTGRMAGDGRSLWIADEQMDAAWAVLLFQHLPAPSVRGYLAELARVLRPGGALVCQFVAREDETPDSFLAYRHGAATVLDWMLEAGFDQCGARPGEQRPDWTWAWATRDARQ